MKKPLTRMLLLALAILILGGAALWGVFRLLPDRTGQTRVYEPQGQNVFLPETDEDIVLYPLSEVSEETPDEQSDPEETECTHELSMGIACNATAYFLQNCGITDSKDGIFLANDDRTLLGVQDAPVDVILWDEQQTLYPKEVMEADDIGTTKGTEKQYLVTAVVNYKLPMLCYLELRPVGWEPGTGTAGYEKLSELAKHPKLGPEDNPFFFFAEQYSNFADAYGLLDAVEAMSVIDAVMSGDAVSFLYEGIAYFCYSYRGVNVTLLFDQQSGDFLGFSAEPY